MLVSFTEYELKVFKVFEVLPLIPLDLLLEPKGDAFLVKCNHWDQLSIISQIFEQSVTSVSQIINNNWPQFWDHTLHYSDNTSFQSV